MRYLAYALLACALAGCGDDRPSSPVLPDPAQPPKPKVSAAPAPAATAQPVAQDRKPDPDAELSARVRKALGVLPDGHGIDVTASQGTVRLWGTVPSAAARSDAAKIAAAVSGVGGVENRLVVLKGS